MVVSSCGDSGNTKTRLPVCVLRRDPSMLTSFVAFWVASATFSFRSQPPTSVSWSPDASLLAVAFANHVILYDPLTARQHCVLASPEVTNIISCYFVGCLGRHLVVQASQDIALWDLVLPKGMSPETEPRDSMTTVLSIMALAQRNGHRQGHPK